MLAVCLLLVPSCKKSTDKTEPNSTNTVNVEPANSKMIPLPTDLPQPMFIGTERDIKVPNLEQQRRKGEKRPLFYVPVGSTNVAFGKPITSSDPEPIIGDLEMITDGDKAGSDGSNVELSPMAQHVTIDLGEEFDIYAVLFWHFHKNARVYFDVIVQLANDPDFTKDVTTLFNNDDDNSSGLGIGSDMNYIETYEGKLIDAKGTKARYVRLYSSGNHLDGMNHYIEVEVFGKPPE